MNFLCVMLLAAAWIIPAVVTIPISNCSAFTAADVDNYW